MRAWWQRRSSRMRLAIWNVAAVVPAIAVFLGAIAFVDAMKWEGAAGWATLVLVAVAVFTAFGFASYAIANRVIAPVRDMADRARSLSVGQLADRLPVANPHDDLGRLAVGLNEALGRFEIAYRALDRLTADVSHELRTPLTAMRSIGQVALQEQDPAALHNALGGMLEEVERMNHLINRLLLLARADNNEIPVQLEAALVGRVLAEVLEVHGRVAEEKRQRMEIDCPDYLLAVFDPALLRLAMMNLVQNAIRHSPPDTRILVRASVRNDRVEIEVVDEGPGIAPEHQGRIFERFYRVDKARSRADGGVGLGLAIVKWAVERMDGSVDLRSEVGGGCTFRVCLRRVAG